MIENKENFVSALIAEPRKRDAGHVLSSIFTAVTKELRVATILSAENLKRKAKYAHFEFNFAESKIVK